MTSLFCRRLQKSRLITIVTVVTACLVVHNEYTAYWLQAWLGWPTLGCRPGSTGCVKILVASDPQILGERMKLPTLIERLAIWDSDRYLAKTFRLASYYFEPDVVVFLGDLMDEGSVASGEEFSRYFDRFVDIFPPGGSAKIIYIPGDNDIGGENEPILADVAQRFQESFNQLDIVKINNFHFYKVNRLTYSIPQPLDVYPNSTRIVVSHLPLLFIPMQFVKNVVDQIRPHFIFSGHLHKSLRITANRVTGEEILVKAMLPDGGPVWRFMLHDSLVHEVMVPTCSYRMGTEEIGYGAAVIDVDAGIASYAVLWLPSRFPQLFVYLGILASLLTLSCVLLACRLCPSLRPRRWC